MSIGLLLKPIFCNKNNGLWLDPQERSICILNAFHERSGPGRGVELFSRETHHQQNDPVQSPHRPAQEKILEIALVFGGKPLAR